MKSALFIDFDNIFSCLRNQDAVFAQEFAQNPSKLIEWLEEISLNYRGQSQDTTRRILVRKVYINPKAFGDYSPYFTRSGFDVVDCPPVTNQGKTSADIHIVLDAIDLLSHPVGYDEFIIMSADADFRPLLQRLRSWDKRTCLLISGFSSAAYRASADVVLDLEQFHDGVLAENHQNNASDETINELRELLGRSDDQEIIAECSKIIIQHVQNSSEPIRVGNVTTQTRLRDMGLAPDWCGYKNFTCFLNSLPLGNLKVEHGWVYDPGLHDQPEQHQDSQADIKVFFRTNHPKINPLATKLNKIIDTPYLLPDDYRFLFKAMAEEINLNGFYLTQLSKTVRDKCRCNNMNISRQTTNLIISAFNSTGHYLHGSREKNPIELANQFLEITLRFCDRAQINISVEEDKLLRNWFGCD